MLMFSVVRFRVGPDTEQPSPSSGSFSIDPHVFGCTNPLFCETEGVSFWTGRGVSGASGAVGAVVAGSDVEGTSGVRGGTETGARHPDGDREEGRILFYHKPTLANLPAGDIPDVVPVYLNCPGGGMALGLPLNEAWQGGEQQVRLYLFSW